MERSFGPTTELRRLISRYSIDADDSVLFDGARATDADVMVLKSAIALLEQMLAELHPADELEADA